MGRGLRKALSNSAAAVVNYLFGRDMDGISLPESRPNWSRRVRAAGVKDMGPLSSDGRTAGRRAIRKRPSIDRGGSTAPNSGDPSPELTAHREKVRLAEAVEEARREWVAARNYFDHVVDPDLIDFAVLSIGAAEKRYMFLLDEARRAGVQVDPLTLNV